MAISIRATGTATFGTANLTPAIPAGATGGDMMICVYGTKPYSDAPTINNGWTSLGSATDGTVAAGVDVGSMQTRILYKEHTGTESDPTVTNTTNNVSGALIIVFQKTTGTWGIAGAGGGDNTVGSVFAVTMSSDVGHTAGDMVVGGAAFRSDAATPVTINSMIIAGTTLGSYTKSPATDPETTSGGDMGMTIGYIPVNSGTSTSAPEFNCTLGGAHTGSAFFARLREVAVSFVFNNTLPLMGAG